MFPADQVRACTSCPLCQSCSGPVPGFGPLDSPVMFIGEAPGREEDEKGIPFVGKAGRLLDSLLSSIGSGRGNVYASNVVKCRPPNNATPSVSQVRSCAHWLDLELAVVHPRTVVLLGATAIRRVLGPSAGTVEHLHGHPISADGTVYLPMYHPAAALYETAQLRHIYDDFGVLKGLLDGRSPESYMAVDDYPDPTYVDVSNTAWLNSLYNHIESSGLVAADVETVDDKLWSIQVCIDPGTAYFVGPELVDLFRFPPDTTVIFHNYLYDYQFVRVDRFVDTMVMAYLLGLPQGLKELAYRLCGMEMRSYDDLVSGAGRGDAAEYLVRALSGKWPDPSPITEPRWDNRAGKVVDKVRRPQHILRKVRRILADYVDNPTVDPYRRWRDIDPLERRDVEAALGPMSASTIASIPRPEAVTYAARDADATLRVYRAMTPKIEGYGLGFTLGVDLGVLPVVQEMMDTGVALDTGYLRSLSDEYSSRMAVLASGAADKIGYPFNPNSSDQVAKVVYGAKGDGGLGFPVTKKTPTGLISTDDRELKRADHPVVKDILRYRQVAKNKDAFADGLLERVVQHDGHWRVHTTLKTTRVETGRLSSSNPNLQAMPTRTKEGKRIRQAFVATPEGE